LEALIEAGHDIKIVISQADSRRNRNRPPEPTKVKAVAMAHGIFCSHDIDDLLKFSSAIDMAIVVAFGQIIKPHILDAIPLINIHFSLLPRWRGAAPVERAILAGDRQTGVCLMAVDKGLDTGDVYASEKVSIDDKITSHELRLLLTDLGIKLLLAKLATVETSKHYGDLVATGSSGILKHYFGKGDPQIGEVTYAAKITRDELRIDWRDSPEVILRKIRIGKAWTLFRGGRLIIHEAELGNPDYEEINSVNHMEPVLENSQATNIEPQVKTPLYQGLILSGGLVIAGDGFVKLRKIQSEGRSALDFDRWVSGVHLQPGEILGV